MFNIIVWHWSIRAAFFGHLNKTRMSNVLHPWKSKSRTTYNSTGQGNSRLQTITLVQGWRVGSARRCCRLNWRRRSEWVGFGLLLLNFSIRRRSKILWRHKQIFLFDATVSSDFLSFETISEKLKNNFWNHRSKVTCQVVTNGEKIDLISTGIFILRSGEKSNECRIQDVLVLLLVSNWAQYHW